MKNDKQKLVARAEHLVSELKQIFKSSQLYISDTFF